MLKVIRLETGEDRRSSIETIRFLRLEPELEDFVFSSSGFRRNPSDPQNSGSFHFPLLMVDPEPDRPSKCA